MKPASDLLKEFNNQNILPNSEYLKENCEVFWEKASEHSNKLELETSIKFACVYLKDRFNDPVRQINDSKPSGSKSKNKKSSHRTSRNSSSAIPEALEFHRDYFHLRSPIWESVPMTTLLQSSSNSSEDLAKIHLHPKTFNPLESFHDDRFLWPWQRCFKLNKNREFEYSSIKTVSLVFDLRNSTVAMEQLPKGKLGHYSPFLERVIDRAKVIIMLHGGFFDKETGDGIVAHFTDVLHLDKSQKRAFDAAVQIIHDISKICDDFQKKLNLGIENLSPSVGLHEEMSVWVAESNQIRAVGESVILASRLCDETDPKAIFISNSFYQSINDCVLDEIKRRFVKKTYYGKENGNTPSYYGYQVNF